MSSHSCEGFLSLGVVFTRLNVIVAVLIHGKKHLRRYCHDVSLQCDQYIERDEMACKVTQMKQVS